MDATDGDLIPVVDYARASVDKRKDEHSVRNQQTTNTQTAKRLGCRIVARFSDNDKSAAKEDLVRDGFEAMLRVLRTGHLEDGTPVSGCIVVHDDRLIRKAGDYERFVDALTYREGRVYADQRGFMDLYSENVENMGLMGAVASRIEIKKMRRRMRQHHSDNAREGKPLQGPRPFGWQKDGVTLDPAESALLRQAAERFIAGGSINSICRDWLKKGVKTSRGNEWTSRTLTVALKKPRLCGWRILNGEIVRDDDGNPIVGAWDSIITPEQWQAIQAIFAERSGKQIGPDGVLLGNLQRDHREHQYLLTATLRCGVILPDGAMCNHKLRAGFQKKMGRHRYFCQAPSNGGCGKLARRGDLIDEFVSEAVLAKLEQRSTVEIKEVGPWPKKRELAEKVEQFNELRARFAKRKITNSLFFEEIERLEPDIAKLRAEAEKYELESARAKRDLTEIRRRWYSETDDDRLDLSQKRAYIREALHAVIVHPAGKGHGKRFDPDLLEPIWRED
ncbi:recombinase family protein [Actinomadura terrae]|uniref:recombinase family protein n=1 Tax=Actinomadura terrae TaxID=604353 RepID=UPI001FA7072D|nr:recombinase family protein [Actinomadura terrae]